MVFVEEVMVPVCVFHEESGTVLVSAQSQCPHTKFVSLVEPSKRRYRRSSIFSHLHIRKSLKDHMHIYGHTESIEDFIHEFGYLDTVQSCLQQDKDPFEVTEAFGAFIGLVRDAVEESDMYGGKSMEEKAEVMERVESFLTRKLHTYVFPKEPTESDLHFYTKTKQLAWIQPHHLSIPPIYSDEMWVSAIRSLRDIDDCRSAAAKMSCLVEFFGQIVAVLELCGTAEAGSSESVPMSIYLLIQTQPPRIHSNINFINRFRNPSKMIEEGGFCVTAIQSAISFIENISHEVLGISEEEYRFRMTTSPY